MDDQEIVDALNVRAEAATKLAMVAIEFQMMIATRLGLPLDLHGSADALISSEAIDTLDAETFKIEKASRERAAAILRALADQAG